MKKITLKDVSSRADLEQKVAFLYEKTPAKKSAKIVGSVEELAKLKLRHGQHVFGVVVEAKNYKQPVDSERPKRGTMYVTKLNGNVTNKNNVQDN